MIKQLHLLTTIALTTLLSVQVAIGQIHTIPAAPYDSITTLPWNDTKIAAKWDSIGYPNGWNAFSVMVNLEQLFGPKMLTFTVPSSWEQKAGTATANTLANEEVQALILPLVKVPNGVDSIKLSFDFTTDAQRKLYLAVLEEGSNRFNTSKFISAMVSLFTSTPIELEAKNAPDVTKVEYTFDMAKYPSREMNIVILAADISLLSPNKGSYGIGNVKLSNAATPTDVIETTDALPYVTNTAGGITVCNLTPGSLIEVYSLTGAPVLKTTASSTTANCSIQQGIYVVKVVAKKQVNSFKVVVK